MPIGGKSMYRKMKKITALVIAFIILFLNFNTLGICIGEVIASSIEAQNSKTNNSNVEFNVYFENQNEKLYESNKKVNEENTIVAEINVKNTGYLKNARIEFDNPNFVMGEIESDYVESVEENIINLSQINSDENIKIEIPVKFEHGEIINYELLSKETSVNFTADYLGGNGKEKDIKKDFKIKLNWTGDIQIDLLGEVTKYIPFEISENKGLLVEMKVTENVAYDILPIKQSNIEIDIPQIKGRNIDKITASFNGVQLDDNRCIYDNETNKLRIINSNDLKINNDLEFKTKGEYIVTLTYLDEQLSENIETEDENTIANDISIANENDNGLNFEIKVKDNLVMYTFDEMTIEKDYNNIVVLQESFGEIVETEFITDENISKAYFYSNLDTEEKQETVYSEKIITKISNDDLVDELAFNLNQDYYNTEYGKVLSNSLYKNLKLDKMEFLKILGEEGKIEIYAGTELLGEIILDSFGEELGQILIGLNNNSNINIKTTKPIAVGEFTVEIEKTIVEENYNEFQTSKLLNIETDGNIKVVKDGVEIINKEINKTIELTELVFETELEINEENFSTMVENENIEIRAILKNNTLNNKLFKNPVVLVNLPSYIENIEVKNVQLLFDDELEIVEANLVENVDGTKQIAIRLNGIQTKYNIDSIYKGANILINANITINKLTPNMEDKIVLTVISGEEQIQNERVINYVAPIGLVAVNEISNYAVGANLMALTDDVNDVLEVKTQGIIATSKIQIINNYNNNIENVRILGRTLATGTTNTESNEQLENTFDAPMLGAINTNGLENVKVYYSENGSATEELMDPNNGWTVQVEDYGRIKSYLIVMEGYTIEKSNSVLFTYDVLIPENLNYAEEVSSVYTVHFDNVQDQRIINDKVTSKMIKLGTGTAPDLSVALKSYSEENSIVREGQYVRYVVAVKNNGTEEAKNAKLTLPAPNANVYYVFASDGKVSFTQNESMVSDKERQLAFSYNTIHTQWVEGFTDNGNNQQYQNEYMDGNANDKIVDIGNIKPGETKTYVYDLKMNNVNILEHNFPIDASGNEVEPDQLMTNQVKATADNIGKEAFSNEYTLKLEKSSLKLRVSTSEYPSVTLSPATKWKAFLRIEQTDTKAINNVVARIKLANGVGISKITLNELSLKEDLKYTTEFDATKNEEIIKIEKLPADSLIEFEMEMYITNAENESTIIATVGADGVGEHYSNIMTNPVGTSKMTIEKKELSNNYIKEGEEVTFEYIIKNTGDSDVIIAKFESEVPDGMKYVKGEVVDEQGKSYGTISENDSGTLELNLYGVKKGATLNAKITLKAKLLPSGMLEKEVESQAKLTGEGIQEVQSNKIKAIIEYYEAAHNGNENESDPDEPDEPVVDGKYIISGVAWLDENGDGKREDSEERLSGIEIRLVDKYTNETIKDVDSGEEKIMLTSSKGEYKFSNLEKGEYLVVAIYNNSKYKLTQYKSKSISSSLNSDFIQMEMNINGKMTSVGVSDGIELSLTNARNIDIGLCASTESDLKLDKYITAVNVKYSGTSKNYTYNDTTLAKVEIPAKNIANATVAVTYKIAVTNEAGISNYVKKIIDYVPSGMKFSSELNKDWYQSSDGNIYNSSLSNTELKPGETKEVTLTLTKTMTTSNTGVVNNNAEIYEVYNEQGLSDRDSTPANKKAKEDDLGSADIVIGVKTGDAIFYTILIASIICLAMGAVIFVIIKKILPNEERGE